MTFTNRYSYNPVGELLSVTDGLGNTLRHVYNNGGQLTEVVDQTGISSRYMYDNKGNKIYMIDGRGKVTEYTYGSFGLLITVTDADNQSIEYGYDLAKNMTVQIDRMGRHTRYEYDNQKRLIERSIDETGDTIAYAYDAIGNRIQMIDISGVSSYQYDENQRLTSIRKDGSAQIGYTYDKIGNVLTVTDSKGFTTSYTYDQSSRMNTVSFGGHTTTYSYDENGNRIAVIYEGGVSEVYTFDRNNSLITLSNQKPNGSVVSSYSYTYDIAGRQATKSDSFGTTNYTYDAAGRIIRVEMPGKTTIYAYDKAGNRQSLHETYVSSQPSGYINPQSGEAVMYAVKKSEYLYSSTNELLSLTEYMYDNAGKELLQKTVTYLYDENGNEIRQRVSYLHPHDAAMRQQTGGNPYGDTIDDRSINTLIEKVSSSYDGFNRLISRETIKAGVRSTVEFVYDGDNLRTEKKSRSSKDSYVEHVTRYLYDRQYVILETNAIDEVQTRYINGVNYIARIDAAEKVSYYLYNGHGDVVQTVSETGEVENTYDYDIFGTPILSIESYANAIRYAGEFYDEESGLYYLRARYYDSYIGRFISEDSYWGEDNNPLSLNRYTYTHNDPINYIDPSGHAAVPTANERRIALAAGILAALTGKTSKSEVESIVSKVTTIVETNTSSSSSSSSNSSSSNSSSSSPSSYANSDSKNSLPPEWLDWDRDGVVDTRQDHSNFDKNGNGIADWLEETSAQFDKNSEGSVKVLSSPERYVDSQTFNGVGLREYAESQGGHVSWDNKAGISSITINGTTRRFDIKDYQVVDGRIRIDSTQFDNAFKARITLFQHGVNADKETFTEMTGSLGKQEKVVDLGVITNSGVEYNLSAKVKQIFKTLGLNTNTDLTIADKLLAHGYNVIYRTNFSNPTGGHYEQIEELSSYINQVTHDDEKVNLVGHSKGGLVSIGYTAYNHNRVNKVITVDTPYMPNLFAQASVEAMDTAHDILINRRTALIEEGPGIRNWRETAVNLAEAAFEKAMDEGTRGSQSDYNKIGGLRDLAGGTTALELIRNQWNAQQANGKLSTVHSFAIATDSYDNKRYKIKLSDNNGDMIVSLPSQRGEGFNGITPFTYTVTGDNRNTEAYSHTGITDRKPMINIIKAGLGF